MNANKSGGDTLSSPHAAPAALQELFRPEILDAAFFQCVVVSIDLKKDE
jgi:hypothetical protein